jgi:cytochrome b-561 domain-containing protein 2
MFERLETVLNALNHSLIAITSCYLTWYCLYTGFYEPTTFHAWFSAIGFQLLMAEGILTMYGKNVLRNFIEN